MSLNNVHTKSVARLVDSENWSKTIFFSKKNKKQCAHTKSAAARLVDRVNLSKKKIVKKKQHTHTKSVDRLISR